MGATSQTKRAPDADGPAKRKRRRRNVRTEVSDSDSSSSSEDEKSEAEVEMQDAPIAVGSSDSESDDEQEEAAAAGAGRLFTEKSGRIPSPLRDLHDPQADARFEEYYMRLLTTEFGDDLNSVRLSKDFGDKSLPMLVRALRQGVNIFNAEEKRVVVGAE